jgi:hypothetical protein
MNVFPSITKLQRVQVRQVTHPQRVLTKLPTTGPGAPGEASPGFHSLASPEPVSATQFQITSDFNMIAKWNQSGSPRRTLEAPGQLGKQLKETSRAQGKQREAGANVEGGGPALQAL